MDYGLRISNVGDVKTASDLDCSITSKYANLKGILSGNGSIYVPSGTLQTVTINHGLGYIPFARLFIDLNRDGNYQEIPTFDTGSIYTYWEFYSRCDSSNTYLDFIWGSDFGDNNTFNYKYSIYLDKGKI